MSEIEAPPRFRWIPPRDGSRLATVEGVAAKIGRSLDPAQRLAVDVLTSSWADLRPATLEACIVAPRQNLKTYCLENIVLARLLHPKAADRLVIWSAHEVATAQETFGAILDLADRFPWLGQQIAGTSRSPGRESIRFANGSRLRFRARIKTGGRGLAGDLIVLDEAFALADEHMGSLLPILSTRARGQVIYGSSAPRADSRILRRIMDRGRAGGPGAPAYVEWSSEGSLLKPGCAAGRDCAHYQGTPGCVLDDETRWAQANSGYVYGRISIDYLRAERVALPPGEFARERMGWADELDAAARPITDDDWAAVLVDGDRPEAVEVFFVAVAPEQAAAAVAAAWWDGEGRPRLEVVDTRPGTAWLPARCAELERRYPGASWWDDGEAAGAARDEIAAAGPGVARAKPGSMADACGKLQRLVRDRALTVQPAPPLDVAFRGAVRRDVGDGRWTWTQRKSTTDIAPLIAVTGALGQLAPAYDLLDSVL